MDNHTRKDISAQYKNRVQIGGVFGIKCTAANQLWIRKTEDMQGSKNRFSFSVSTRSCPEPRMLESWKAYGPESFTFEVLEELPKKETQTADEFSADIAVLYEMWQDKTAN